MLTIGGESLVHRSLRTAVETGIFDRIILSSNDPRARAEASEFKEVFAFGRNPKLSEDKVESAAVVFDVLSRLNYQPDAFCLLNPSSPCRTADQLKSAYHAFSGGLDCLYSTDSSGKHNGDFLFWNTLAFLRYVSRSILSGENFILTHGIDINVEDDYNRAKSLLSRA